ncbi:short-chain dehydrogenase/reductase family 16C member 6 [Culicoides brevitarsis]|uniref:short-chain dehydrogenase/reductase family 16C member 6 n=1 Tax=Culicoides brevitarsis TaxID=469753 RepID=UPI00307C7B2B
MVANDGTDVAFEKPPPMCNENGDKTRQVPKKPIKLNKKNEPPNLYNTIMDIITFLLVSAGHILQTFYYTMFGYPKKDLKGELALITGGGGGLGRLLALRLVRLGVKVIIWDINQDAIDETCKIITSMGGYCKGYVVDISKREEVYKMADEIRNRIGDVTLLFNNAGVVSGRLLLDTPDHMIERSFNVNAIAHFWTVKAFLPAMIEKDHGHIITIASMAGHVGISKLVDYCASKFAAVGFDESLRLELEILGCRNVHTTVICPYFIQATGMFDDVHSRWVPTLDSNHVADRIISGVRKNHKCVIVPEYFRWMLIIKWVFPWPCNSGFLRRLVLDAAPQHHTISPTLQKCESALLAAASSSNGMTTVNNNGTAKPNQLLVQRTASTGERVL